MSTTRTQEFFQKYAGDFDAIYANQDGVFNRVINHLFRKSMQLRFLKTMEVCEPVTGKTVLDIGCGPGHYSIALAKRGAVKVIGLDFAEEMIALAEQHAQAQGVSSQCQFLNRDLFTYTSAEPFDRIVVMGVMDYMQEPVKVIEKVLSLCKDRCFFSFPEAGGFLAWQRKFRYRNRCELYMYTQAQLEEMFRAIPDVKAKIEPIARDFFVTVEKNQSMIVALHLH